MKTAVDMLRDFANFKGDGLRSIVRMLRMQEDARKLLKRIDQQRSRRKRIDA